VPDARLPLVVFCSEVAWERPHSGTHAYFLRLCELTEAIHVDPPLSVLHLGRRPGVVSALARRAAAGLASRRPVRVGERAHVLAPAPISPLGLVSRHRNDAYYRRLGRRLGRFLREVGSDRHILWTCDPYSHGLGRELGSGLVVYHCVQDFGAVPVPAPIGRLRVAQEARLARSADVVFAQTDELAARLGAHNASSHCFPSAVDTALFAADRAGRLDEPADIAGLPRPLVLWIGMVSPAVDVELLVETAAGLERGTLVIIGGVHHANPRFRTLIEMPRVAFLGFRAHHELPAYLARAEVCLVPYVDSAFVRGVSSQKLYEYLAMGRKVVASAYPESIRHADALWLARERSAFVPLVRTALAEPGHPRRSEALAVAAANSLDARLASMLEILDLTARAGRRPGADVAGVR
jgi:UDP-galactopyranose mutase